MKFKKEDKLYSFIGEELLELDFISEIDNLRILVSDENNNYVLYKKFCYLLKDEAIANMYWFISTIIARL